LIVSILKSKYHDKAIMIFGIHYPELS